MSSAWPCHGEFPYFRGYADETCAANFLSGNAGFARIHQLLERFLMAALLAQQCAEVVMCGTVARFQFNRLAVGGFGFTEIAHAATCRSKRRPGLGIFVVLLE